MAARLRLTNRFRKARGDSLPEYLSHIQTPQDEQYHQNKTYAASVREAYDWLQETIRHSNRWTDHLSQIRLECPYTLPELHQIGRLPRAEGVAQCQRMIRIPVIYDEIGLFVWTTLAEMKSGADGQPDQESDKDQAMAEEQKKHSEEFSRLEEPFRFEQCRMSGSSDIGKERGNSPPASPKTAAMRSFSPSPYVFRRSVSINRQQDFPFCCQESVEEVPHETGSSEYDISVRGRVWNRNSAQSFESRESDTGFFNTNTTSTDGTLRGRVRSGSFGEEVSSIVERLSRNVVTALGGRLSHRQDQRSFLLSRRSC